MARWSTPDRFPGDTRIESADEAGPRFELDGESWLQIGGDAGRSGTPERVTAGKVVDLVGSELAPFVWAATTREALRRCQALAVALVSAVDFPGALSGVQARFNAMNAAVRDLEELATRNRASPSD